VHLSDIANVKLVIVGSIGEMKLFPTLVPFVFSSDRLAVLYYGLFEGVLQSDGVRDSYKRLKFRTFYPYRK
jgi:hypothetical protein